MNLFSNLAAFLQKRKARRLLIKGIRRSDLTLIRRAIDMKAPMEGWKAKGPETIMGSASVPGVRFTNEGAIELATDCGCPREVYALLIDGGARISDRFGNPQHQGKYWKRREEWKARMKGRGNFEKCLPAVRLVEAAWEGQQMAMATPQARGARRALARL